MLADVIDSALNSPGRGGGTAVADHGRALGYAELREQIARTAKQLAETLGDRPDGAGRARVAIAAGNSVSYVVAFGACLAAGAAPFLVDAATGDDEFAEIDDDCTFDLVLRDRTDAGVPLEGADGLSALRLEGRQRRYPLHPDTEVCRFTSGTTGKPNCIEFSGAAVAGAARNWVAGTGLTAQDRILCYAGLSNGLAFNTSLLAAFLAGAALHLSPGLPTAGRVSRDLRALTPTRLVGFPALYDALAGRADLGEVCRGLRQAISSGAPLDEAAAKRFHAETGIAISDYYGLAEAGPLTFAPKPGPGRGLGPALPEVSIEAGEPDEPRLVRVRSASMATRYLNAPGLLESRIGADGRYDTGDRGYLDEAGVLFLTGRTARVVNVGGRKIDPAEVARVLRALDGVGDAAVFAVTDRHGREALGAVVASRTLDAPAVRALAADRLSAHKVPGLLRVVEALPGGAIGKPSIARLRELVLAPPPPADRPEETNDHDHA